jgi:hypothetical protein
VSGRRKRASACSAWTPTAAESGGARMKEAIVTQNTLATNTPPASSGIRWADAEPAGSARRNIESSSLLQTMGRCEAVPSAQARLRLRPTKLGPGPECGRGASARRGVFQQGLGKTRSRGGAPLPQGRQRQSHPPSTDDVSPFCGARTRVAPFGQISALQGSWGSVRGKRLGWSSGHGLRARTCWVRR